MVWYGTDYARDKDEMEVAGEGCVGWGLLW